MILFCLYMVVLLPLSFSADKDDELVAAGRWICPESGLNIKRARLLVISCSGVLVAIVDGILWSDYVYRSGCSPSLPGYIPYIRPSDTDACHFVGRGFVGVGV